MIRKLMVMLAAAVAATCSARAETETVGGYTWPYQIDGDTAVIYCGYDIYEEVHFEISSTFISPSPRGAVTIPATLGGKPVTGIGYRAFYNCSGLTSVTIPDSVTNIGSYAFSGCSGLASVTIPDSVTNIGSYAFSGCSGLTSVTIPDGVTSIGESAFSRCSGLASVTIPDSVTNIGSSAFSGCSDSLFDMTTIPGIKLVDGWAVGNTGSLSGDLNLTGIRGIGPSAFSGCSGLKSVTIPDGVTSIGPSAFSGCSGLTSVTLPDSVTNIGSYAFSGCSGLTSVTIPGSVTNIGSYAFSGCSGLKSVTIPDGVTSIGYHAFSGCSGLTNVTIPDSVTSIGSWAFDGCSDSLFDTTTIPGMKLVDGWAVGNTGSLSGDLNLTGIRGIGPYAFYDCRGLTSVTIPDGVTSIGDSAFSGCSGLESMTIPDSVTRIGPSAFSGCSGLTSVTIPDGVTSIGHSAFHRCSGLTSVTIPDSVTSIGDEAFYRCSGLESVTIPGSVTSIGRYAFSGCSGLASMTIPDSVTSIGDYAFSGCSGLASMTIPQVVCSSRLSSVFSDSYTTITNVVVVDGVTSIGVSAFHGCSGLASVTIPDSVTSVGDWAFFGCKGLTSVTIPQIVCSSRLSSVFSGSYATITNVVVVDGVTSIGPSAFSGCSGLRSVTIPDGVTSIGSSAFYGCSGLANVTIPDSVTNIGSYAFSGCIGLTTISVGAGNANYKSVNGLLLSKDGKNLIRGVNGNVTIPDSVTSIWSYAFSGCSGLASVTIPDSVTSIGSYAFSGCSGLASVTIPDAVTSIGDSAFSGCSASLFDTTTVRGLRLVDGWAAGYAKGSIYINLDLSGIRGIVDRALEGLDVKNLTVGADIRHVGASAFSGCLKLESVTISDGVTSIGAGAFAGCRSLRTATLPRRFEGKLAGNVFEGCPLDLAITYVDAETARLFTVTFDAQGGSLGTTRPTVVTNGCAVGELPVPTRDGFSFDGWFTAASGGTEVSSATVVTDTVTFYAHWTEQPLYPTPVWYDEDGEEIDWTRYYDGDEEPFAAEVAATFDGYVLDGEEVCGIVRVKVGKANKKTETAKVTAALTLLGDPKKRSYKGTMSKRGIAELTCNGKGNLSLCFGTNAMWGEVDGWSVSGSRNVFAKAGDPKAAALKAWQGTYTLVLETVDAEGAGSAFAWGYSGLTLTVGAKGKVKVTGTMADGAKVNVASQLLVGEKRCCIPVVVPLYSKKGGFGFNLWLQDDGEIEVGELGEWDAAASKTPFRAWFGENVPVARAGGALPSSLSFLFMGEPEIADAEVLYDFVPWEVAVTVGARWGLPVAGSVKLDRESGEYVDAKDSSNAAGLKLTYVAKTGAFKGSFKLYALGGSGRLKKFTAKVSGVMVGRQGYGKATVKGVGSWPVAIQ